MQDHTCPKCWREKFSFTIFPAVRVSPQKYCEKVRYWGIYRESSPQGQECYLIPDCLACLGGCIFKIISFRFWLSDMKWSTPLEKPFTEVLLTAFLGMHSGFSIMCVLGAMMSLCYAELCMLQHCSASLVGRGNFTSFYGANWRALLSPPHLTAQIGWADGCRWGSSTCSDAVRALNAAACVSRSLRYFLQGRMNVIEQVDVEYRVMWACNAWTCPHTVGAQSAITSSVWCMITKPDFLHLSWEDSTPSFPAESNETFYCLTRQILFNSPPWRQDESAWEDELYIACIDKKIKKTDQYLFWFIICILHSTWESKGEDFASVGTWRLNELPEVLMSLLKTWSCGTHYVGCILLIVAPHLIVLRTISAACCAFGGLWLLSAEIWCQGRFIIHT